MTTEQFITIVTTLLTNGGLATFLFFYIRSLKQQITGLNNTIEAQNKTLKIMEKQVLETEKVGNIYRNLVNDLPDFVEKYKKFINDSKDDVIAKLERDKSDDEKLKEARQIELKRLELQEQMISELPKLREQMITAVEAIEERIDAMEPTMFGATYRPTLTGAGLGTLRFSDIQLPSYRILDIGEPVKLVSAGEANEATEEEEQTPAREQEEAEDTGESGESKDQ